MSTSSHERIFSIGTSSRGPEEFLGILKAYGIERVVDVRRFPTSRYEHFRRENLRDLLESRGIEYIYLGKELGGYRKGGYEAYMATPAFEKALEILEALGRERVTAFLCSERLPWRCHRRFIGAALARKGWDVVHIIEEGREWRPAP